MRLIVMLLLTFRLFVSEGFAHHDKDQQELEIEDFLSKPLTDGRRVSIKLVPKDLGLVNSTVFIDFNEDIIQIRSANYLGESEQFRISFPASKNEIDRFKQHVRELGRFDSDEWILSGHCYEISLMGEGNVPATGSLPCQFKLEGNISDPLLPYQQGFYSAHSTWVKSLRDFKKQFGYFEGVKQYKD